jgi:hypothetical protein
LKALANAPLVIGVSMRDQPEYRDYALALGADDFVDKAEFGEQLLPLIYARFTSGGQPNGHR